VRTNLFGRRINVGKDEIYFYNKEREDDRQKMEQFQTENDQLRQQLAAFQANQKA